MGDEADVRDGTHSSPNYYETGYPLVTSKNLTEYGLDLSDVSFISLSDFNEINKRSKVDEGDILLGLIGTIGNPILVDKSGYAIKNVGLIKEKEELKNIFLVQLLKSSIFNNYIFQKNTGNTQKFLSLDTLRNFNFLCPKIEEQTAIGNFFKQLDDTIALHRRNCIKFQNLKTAYLENIFSTKYIQIQNGNKNAWEQRKLGECFAERTERSAIGELISVTMNSGVVKASSLERKDNSSKNKENYKKVEKNDIAYNSMRMWQGASGVSEYSGILSPAYTVLIPQQGVNSIFFSYYFKLDKMLNVFQANSQGLTSDTWNLKYPVLKNILVTIPSLEEQTAIGNFFRQLDDTIALHQRFWVNNNQLGREYAELF